MNIENLKAKALGSYNDILSHTASKNFRIAANPAAILDLIAELEAVKSELKSAEEFVEALKTQHISDLRKAEEKGYLNGLKDFAHMECELESVKAERDALRARIEAAEKQEPVANIGPSFALFWIGSGPIAPIVEKHQLKVGDPLYAAPPMPQECTFHGFDDQSCMEHSKEVPCEPAQQYGLPDTWKLRSAGKIKKGDLISLELAGKRICVTAREILNHGTDREEIIYNRRKNHYFITSMVLDGTSSHKNVYVIPAVGA